MSKSVLRTTGWVLAALAILVLGFYGVVLATIARSNDKMMVVESLEDTTWVPFHRPLARWYFTSIRVEGLSSTEASQLLSFTLNGDSSPGRDQIAEHLIGHGADVNARVPAGVTRFTLLQAAIFHNDVEAVAFLLKHGADPSEQVQSAGSAKVRWQGLDARAFAQDKRRHATGEDADRLDRILALLDP